MEQGTLVAIVALVGSFLTVLITGAVNIWSKWIESEQKVKEHKLSIRNTYVSKKIEAGQLFVARNNVLVHKFHYQISHLREMIATGNSNSDLLSGIQDMHIKLNENHSGSNDYTELYFDISKYNNNYNNLMKMSNDYGFILNVSEIGSEQFNDYANKIIVIFEDAINIILQSSDDVRDNLGKYDVI